MTSESATWLGSHNLGTRDSKYTYHMYTYDHANDSMVSKVIHRLSTGIEVRDDVGAYEAYNANLRSHSPATVYLYTRVCPYEIL